MKKAIVTGSTGFIGSNFVEYLISRDIEVLSLGRKTLDKVSFIRQQKLKSSNYLQLDMSEIFHLDLAIKKINWDVGNECVFFNLAWGGEKSLSDLNITAQLKNVEWSVTALEVAKKIGCSRFIQIGTMEEAFTNIYLELDHHKNKQHNRHVIYSVAKMAAKNALKLKAESLGIDFIYVFHSHVMGPDDDKDSFLQVTLQKLICGDELIFSNGEQYFDVVSVSDCSLGYYLISIKGEPGNEYWVGSGAPRRLRDYVETMYRLYPSSQDMQFGTLNYNDVVLEKEVFSISVLVEHTGYQPLMTFEQIVRKLYHHLIATKS